MFRARQSLSAVPRVEAVLDTFRLLFQPTAMMATSMVDASATTRPSHHTTSREDIPSRRRRRRGRVNITTGTGGRGTWF